MLSTDIGIDLGTSNILIYIKKQGIVVNEPSIVAIDKNSKRVLAVGKEAAEMYERTPGKISAIKPLKNGVIADMEITEIMLNELIKKVKLKKQFIKPRILICCPTNITTQEKENIKNASVMIFANERFSDTNDIVSEEAKQIFSEKDSSCVEHIDEVIETSEATKENISITDDALNEIAKISDGGMRDSINFLDQLRSFSQGNISIEDVYEVCGNVSNQSITEMFINLKNNELENVVSFLENLGNNGKSYSKFLEDLMIFFMHHIPDIRKYVKKILKNIRSSSSTRCFIAGSST